MDSINSAFNPAFWDSITCLRHRIHDEQEIAKIIYLSNYRPVQPKDNFESMEQSKAFLSYLQIGGILNTTINRLPLQHHCEFYDDVEITYREYLIPDDTTNGFQDGFLEGCLKHFHEFPNDQPVLIHCSAGQNRSAAAAAAIIWVTTPLPRPWKSPEEMIDWMRICQQRDRACRLLKNPVFYCQVIDWCNQYDEQLLDKIEN